MERTFTRAARSHLQPVEIGKRLVRAMETEQSVGVQGVIVPNVYEVHLSRHDYVHFEPMRRSLTKNMESHVGRVARQRRLQLVARPVVRLAEDARLSPGDIRVVSHVQDVDTMHGSEAQHTSLLPQLDGPLHSAPATPNIILDGRSYAVLRSPTKVGRLPDNDIVVNDKRVSRHHAEFHRQGSRWTMRDSGSTNGTAVNGKVVKEAVLKPGDTISLGGLEVTWEQ
ncbi:MAG: DUF3662 and FHA domain-containing protein [Chloroflexota bacterium]